MVSTTDDTQLRADARRNRDAVLVAARKIFAEEGLTAPLDMIAREAGVGRATLHRRFPTREVLVAAIFDDNIEELARIAAETVDPAAAFVDTLIATVEMLARDAGFVDLFNRNALAASAKADVGLRFLAIMDEPLRRAQAAGRIRPDLRLDDALLLVDMLGGAMQVPDPARPGDRRQRAVAFVLDAIVPAGAPRPLPLPSRSG
ncbi:MAG TPA: helix-turn-helix domain-containing protein [Conexibacter sp.]|nr:helix-turn-helix domain-containing protein [Conexibacter sp.]